jgi:hypothetical protein
VAKAKPAEEIKTDGIINLTDDAIKQIGKLRESKGEDLVLRVGVRAGGWQPISQAVLLRRTRLVPIVATWCKLRTVAPEAVCAAAACLHSSGRAHPTQVLGNVLCDGV